MVKKYKKARFKAFRKRSEAMQFAIFGMETTGQTGCPTSPLPAESGEKPSPFRAPKPQDMVRFRKAIESGDIDFVKRTVWENPRYIVSSGDTPAILQVNFYFYLYIWHFIFLFEKVNVFSLDFKNFSSLYHLYLFNIIIIKKCCRLIKEGASLFVVHRKGLATMHCTLQPDHEMQPCVPSSWRP